VRRSFGPTNDPNMWLQSIDNLKLTLHGRDGARGRVIQVALLDPDEDDQRIITGLTLDEIARSSHLRRGPGTSSKIRLELARPIAPNGRR
jgi:hypothetical protein